MHFKKNKIVKEDPTLPLSHSQFPHPTHGHTLFPLKKKKKKKNKNLLSLITLAYFYFVVSGGIWYMCLKIYVEIRVGEKVYENACNIV